MTTTWMCAYTSILDNPVKMDKSQKHKLQTLTQEERKGLYSPLTSQGIKILQTKENLGLDGFTGDFY